MSNLQGTLTDLLSTLTAIRWHSWVTHWKSQGPNAYSDHLLFQRIYSGDGGGPKIDDQIDGLGERIIALFGNSAVDGVEVSQRATQIHQTIRGLGMIAGALKLEQVALKKAAAAAAQVSRGPAALKISLDNFVREVADARSTVIYLLQQRLKGGAVDNYGGFDEAPLTQKALPVLIFSWASYLVARRTGAVDPRMAAAVGGIFGIIWSRPPAYAEEPEEARPNNVVYLNDYRGLNTTEGEWASARGKRNRILLLSIAGLMSWAAYQSGRRGR